MDPAEATNLRQMKLEIRESQVGARPDPFSLNSSAPELKPKEPSAVSLVSRGQIGFRPH